MPVTRTIPRIIRMTAIGDEILNEELVIQAISITANSGLSGTSVVILTDGSDNRLLTIASPPDNQYSLTFPQSITVNGLKYSSGPVADDATILIYTV